MQKTLMNGLNEKDMQAVIRSYDLKEFYFPTLFPLRQTNRLEWKMLEAQSGLRIAADLVARGATIPKKTREAISRIQGDIPKLAISREKQEDELTEYDIMVAMASDNTDLKAIVEFWAQDTELCWVGLASRIEYIALSQISNGKVTFTNSNNAAAVTEYNVDYQIPAAQKIGVNTAYGNANVTNGKPLTKDIPAVIKIGKSLGVTYKYAFMNVDTFNRFAEQEEVMKRCATFNESVVSVFDAPDVTMVNNYLNRKKTQFRGLQIVVIDQTITLELADGSRQTLNPFADNTILFSESNVLGATYWKKPIEANDHDGDVSVKAMREYACIRKYSELAPIKEITEGIANAFPAWNLAGRSVLMDISATTWSR